MSLFSAKVALKLYNIFNLYTIKQCTCNLGSDIHRLGYIPIENTALENFQFESTRGAGKTKLVQICVLVSLSERCMVVF